MESIIPITRDEAVLLLGPGEGNLRVIEEELGVKVISRGGVLRVTSSSPAQKRRVEALFDSLRNLAGEGRILSREEVSGLIEQVRERPHREDEPTPQSEFPVIFSGRREAIRPRTPHQREFYEALRDHDVIFAIGPAGTGKTFLAVAFALQALAAGDIDRIILTRPAIEAGESLGFLPGDMREKIDPYLRPIHDALHTMLTGEKLHYYTKNEMIEIAPLAFMRGRTLSHSYAILDEAQNATVMQMKMFLTRLGLHSKAIVTGDITQIDLAQGVSSGLVEIQRILHKVPGIRFCYFDTTDVIRHTLVREIINAYADYEKDHPRIKPARRSREGNRE